ncbi:L-threonylcarbamoyladenylate synthase [Thiomicrospira sp. WB1]|uniref:L-threonylcarbamoyladenylate synthase n=1 Tax=Thiomicrospira sp. WB1 TaxID=1685380 RepID=UPI0007491A15|nr:L-threonylcarbamoyladenylate synthase [Thiomicrospira sp. WB1]KUJ72054.1 translation factor Sua5 [Thiomicrospira sp. WB1]
MAKNACEYIAIHPETPQPRLVGQVADLLQQGGVIAYPTESGYALGCLLDNKEGADRIREIRQLDPKHPFALMCHDLSHLSSYAKVGNTQFRYLKASLPGPYTFILPASREVPRRLQSPKKKYIGLRVTPNAVARAILDCFEQPLITVSLILPGETVPMTDPWEIQETIGHALDGVVDGGHCGFEPTTIIDFTDDVPQLIRQGQGAFTQPGE